MLNIPKTLQRNDFRFCLLKGNSKQPFEKEWTRGYSFDSPKIRNHTGNLGIICGYGNLRVLDIDNLNEIQKWKKEFSETFLVETGTGGLHIYFLSDYGENHVLKGLGEFRAVNSQVVCPDSIHPNGKRYKPLNDNLILRIDGSTLKEFLKPYLKEKPETSTKDLSRSGLEFRRAISEFRKGKYRGEVHNILLAYKKYADAPESYQKLTLDKAEDFALKEEPKEGFKPLNHQELREFQPPPQTWLIENQIPAGEVGLLVGKRGERKSFLAIYQTLCLASQKPCLEDSVPEKKRVIYIDEEMGLTELKKRVSEMEKGLGIQNENLEIIYLSLEGLKLDKPNEKFQQLLEEFQPHLIVVDCLARTISFDVDKDNSSISNFFTSIVRPAIKKYGCSWLFIHHLRKNPSGKTYSADLLDEIRGGSELTNYCRFVLMSQLPKNQEEFAVLSVLKLSNAKKPEPKAISFNQTENGLQISYEGFPEDVFSYETRCASAIKEYLFQNQLFEFTTQQINEHSESIGYKKSVIYLGLNFLRKAGFLIKPKKGVWKVSDSNFQVKF